MLQGRVPHDAVTGAVKVVGQLSWIVKGPERKFRISASSEGSRHMSLLAGGAFLGEVLPHGMVRSVQLGLNQGVTLRVKAEDIP